MQSSRILDTYLYGESNRSVILTFKAFAICSRLSSVGEYFSFMMLLIVDFEMPVMLDNCRTEMLLLYMMLSSNIFMQISFALFYILFFIYSWFVRVKQRRKQHVQKKKVSWMSIYIIIFAVLFRSCPCMVDL